jgi:hypothetical protein
MPARVARPALALVAALLLGGWIAGCGHPPSPIYTRGYDAGLVARDRFIQQRTPASNLAWACAVAAYKDIQDMANSTADLWEDGFNKGCANVGT